METTQVTRWARRCDVTGEGMNEGWYIGGRYAKYQEGADLLAQQAGYTDFKEAFGTTDEEEEEDNTHDPDYCYWTEWNVEEEEEVYEERNGKLVKIKQAV